MFEASPGSLLADRYCLIAKLGQGGMGAVWRAEDRALCIEVAIKLIEPTLVDSPMALSRFQHEAHAAARLRSTHIVHINDYGVDEATGQPFIAMDLLEGESLQQRLDREGKLPFLELQHILVQVARGLELAHSKGIAHRDLKPENIFLAREGGAEVVKLLDFGIAKRFDVLDTRGNLKTGDGQMLGTPYYMSPEQARAASNIDHRTDIWSFGVIAFECLIGYRPFESENLASLVLEICNGPIPVPSRLAPVPSGFNEWFSRTVTRDILARYESIEVAANDFCALLNSPLEKSSHHDSSSKTLTAAAVSASSLATMASSSNLAVPDIGSKLTGKLWRLATPIVIGGVVGIAWISRNSQAPTQHRIGAEEAAATSSEAGTVTVTSESIVTAARGRAAASSESLPDQPPAALAVEKEGAHATTTSASVSSGTIRRTIPSALLRTSRPTLHNPPSDTLRRPPAQRQGSDSSSLDPGI